MTMWKHGDQEACSRADLVRDVVTKAVQREDTKEPHYAVLQPLAVCGCR